MRLKQASLTAAISVVAGLTTATVGLTGSAARADGTAALPLSHYSHMLVDAAHQHIFFSQGAGSTGIVVTDLSGTPVTTIQNEPGATGLALSADGGTLYAALADGDAVAAIDTATLTESTRYATGTGSAPLSVAVAGGRVWYGYTADSKGAVGSLDPSAADPVATPQPSMSHWSVAPLLATGGGVLAAEEPQQNLSHVATFDVSSGTPSVKADTLVYGGTVTGFHVTGDGAEVVLAAPQQPAAHAYRTADLAFASPSGYGAGGTNAAPNSLAADTDGTIAVGSTSASQADLYLYAGSSNLAENHVTLPSGTLTPDGLAWGANGALYAVTRDSSGAYTLDVLSDPKLTDTQLSLTPPQYAVPTQQFTFTGSLSTKGFLPADASLRVTRDGTPLPDATVGKDGSFTVSDTRQDEGACTYQVSYAGDATHRPVTASLTVHVAKLTTTIAFPEVSSATPHSVAFTGSLMTQLNLGSLPQGTTVQVSRTNEDTQETAQLPSVTVDPASTEFTVTDAPDSAGRFTYHLSYAGDATHRPTSSDASVQVSPYTPALTLKAPATATRGTALTFGGTLSDAPYDSGETVTVSRTDAAHTTTPVKWTVPVGADGTITVKDTPSVGGANTYTVSHPGDASHQAATASAIVQVSRTTTALSVTTNASSYAYGATATVTAHLGTTYNGRTVALYAQPYGGGKTLVKTGTVDSSGNLSATYGLTHNTTFTASFAGDYRYGPATATHTAYDQVKIAETLSGYYTSTTYSGTTYRVYHHTVKPRVTAVVTPNKSGQCEKFQAQEYYSGAWHTLTTSGCYYLDANSTWVTQLSLTNAVNQKFRVRSEYVHSTKDNTNLSTWGGWLYFTVRT
ncbi:YncE family protein [Streptomyces puniciscabiei]